MASQQLVENRIVTVLFRDDMVEASFCAIEIQDVIAALGREHDRGATDQCDKFAARNLGPLLRHAPMYCAIRSTMICTLGQPSRLFEL
jgi:hypothetical protein